MIACEHVTYTVLPAVRAILAQELSAEGLTQNEIADALHITQPAVSQYLNRERGEAVEQIRGNDTCWELVYDAVNDVSHGHMLTDDRLEELCHRLLDELSLE